MKPLIVIATDFSDNSQAAEKVGANLAKTLGAKVALVHSFDPMPAVPPIVFPDTTKMEAAIQREISEAVNKRLHEIRSERLGDLEDVTVEAPRANSPAAAICDYAKEHGADWIVVGTQGRTGLPHMLIGSVAEKVVRHAPCNVVVARL